MMEHLPLAFAVDLRVRSRSYPIAGAKLESEEIKEGVVYSHNGMTITAFEVDHGGEELPAFGYRIDYQGHSAVLSGDTTFNENLIAHAQGTDLIVHEVTAASGTAAESPEQLKRIGSNHTTAAQAGEVFARVAPKLAVYNHLLLFGGATADDLIPPTRKHYSGPLVVGEDLMRFDIGENIDAQRFSDLTQPSPTRR
jgi:ribonuclease Z